MNKSCQLGQKGEIFFFFFFQIILRLKLEGKTFIGNSLQRLCPFDVTTVA